MNNFDLMIQLQELYDAYMKIDEIKTRISGLRNLTGKEELSELANLQEVYEGRLSIPKFVINTGPDKQITDERIKDAKARLVNSFLSFEKELDQISSEYAFKAEEMTNKCSSAHESEIAELEEELHKLVDYVNSGELINKKYIEMIPDIINVLGDGRAQSLTDALNQSINEKLEKEKQEEERIRWQMEQISRKEEAEMQAGVAHCSVCWNYHSCVDSIKNTADALECLDFNQ